LSVWSRNRSPHSHRSHKMDLILWRHADAEEGYPDLARSLTAKGHKQAETMAKWLRSRLPKDVSILVSPATRAQQTAQALTSHYHTVKQIAPGADYTAILEAAGWPHGKGTVLIVGHQPTLGEAVAWLLSSEPGQWHIKKAGVWWLGRRDPDDPLVVRAVISPDLV
jgi:phosphohistidine phosphatase